MYRRTCHCPNGVLEQVPQINQCVPTNVRSRAKHYSGTEHWIEHPARNLPIIPFVVVIDLATKRASFPAANDDFLAVQGVPGVEHLADIGLVITLIGTCTTTSTCTAPYAS